MRIKIGLWEMCNFIGFFYCFFASMNRQTEYGFFLLPLAYSILFAICYRSRKLIGKTPGVTVIMCVMFCRYVVLPVVLCSSGELSKYANDYRYMVQAVIIMLYEMFMIFMVLEVTATKAWRIYARQYDQGKKNILVKPPFLVVLIIFCALAGIYLTNQSILNGNIFQVTNVANEFEESIQDVSSLVMIVWQCITAWVFVYSINRQKEKYTVDKRRTHVSISIIFMLVYMLVIYIGQARISRWYTLVSAIAAIFVLISLFPAKKKTIVRTTIIPVVILILIASVLKAGLYTKGGNGNVYSLISKLITPTTGDAYFAGPVSVNNAIGLSQTYNVGFHNIIYYIFNNMPVVNHFIKPGNSTVYLYNAYLGRIFNGSGGDQIISLVGQSGIFFSWILAPLLSCVSVFFLRAVDKKYVETTTYMKYVWGIVAIWFGLETILNMTINLSWLYIRIIPMFVTFWFIEKISPKQIENK